MAFGQGQASSEGGSIKRYTGVASVFVLGVNPLKEELEKFYGRTLESAPEYVGEAEINGNKVPQVRLDFIIKADPDKYLGADNTPIDLVSKVTLYISKAYRYNKDNTKVQVKDKYGRFAWVTVEQAKAHEIPVYSNGSPANIDKDYKPAYVGEEELTKFLIAYLNIPSCQKYVDGKWVMLDADKLADCEASLEHIEDYFKGDVSELKTIIGYQPNNKVKVLFGVKTTDDGKQYQTVYTRMFLKNGVNDYSKLDKDVKSTQESGALSSSEFDCTELHEYVVSNTNFGINTPDSELPFAPPSGNTPWGMN
jgi:hypothetical protein